MNRRQYLILLSGGLGSVGAGCNSFRGNQRVAGGNTPTHTSGPPKTNRPGSDTTTTPSEESSTTEQPGHVHRRTVTLKRTSSELHEKFGVDESVTVTDGTVTEDSTARVLVQLENTTGERRMLSYVDHGTVCGENNITGSHRDNEAELALVHRPRSYGGVWCWRLKYDCLPPRTKATVEIPAGDTVEYEYELWQSAGEDCIPDGDYEFERAFGSKVGGDNLDHESLEGDIARLGFTLSAE